MIDILKFKLNRFVKSYIKTKTKMIVNTKIIAL